MRQKPPSSSLKNLRWVVCVWQAYMKKRANALAASKLARYVVRFRPRENAVSLRQNERVVFENNRQMKP